jgi:hypothetical protein
MLSGKVDRLAHLPGSLRGRIDLAAHHLHDVQLLLAGGFEKPDLLCKLLDRIQGSSNLEMNDCPARVI